MSNLNVGLNIVGMFVSCTESISRDKRSYFTTLIACGKDVFKVISSQEVQGILGEVIELPVYANIYKDSINFRLNSQDM